jgi:hypothetical protein
VKRNERDEKRGREKDRQTGRQTSRQEERETGREGGREKATKEKGDKPMNKISQIKIKHFLIIENVSYSITTINTDCERKNYYLEK